MKKSLTYLLLVAVGIVVGLSASLAVYYATAGELYEKLAGRQVAAETALVGSDATGAELTARAYEVLGYIKDGDFEALSKAVHPEYGVVFAPYATISLSSNKCFTAAQVAAFPEEKTRHLWGKYDGIGEPIELTPSDYFGKFVFDKDFTQAAMVGVDTVVRSGNSLENIAEVFPDARFVDFHDPGTSQEEGGLDWSSLRLAFEEYKGELMLTLILHSQWTI